MGRPKTVNNPKPIEPEQIPEDPPVNWSESLGKVVSSKADAVRAALAFGLESPGDISEFAKSKFGMEIPKPQVSAYKAQQKAKGAGATSKAKPGRKPKSAVDGYLAPPPKIEAKGDGDLLDALEKMKTLVASLGKEKAHRIIDLLG